MKECVEAVNEQDTAMWSTLSGRPLLAKVFFVIAMVASQFQPSIGQQTQFVTPGHEAKACDDKMITNLRRQIEDDNPSVTYINTTFDHDDKATDGYGKLLSLAKEQMQKGRTCIVADSRHTMGR